MTETTFYGKIKSKRVSGLPAGIVRYKLTAPAVDREGKTYPKGTEFVALSGGFDNRVSQSYRRVVIVKKGT